MDHLLIHRLEVLRRATTGTEDGTPVAGGWEPVEWRDHRGQLTGRFFGACRLDVPRDAMVQRNDLSTVTIEKSTVLVGMGCPVKALDRLRVTTDRGPAQVWVLDGTGDAGDAQGTHHLEIRVSREVHR